MNNKKSAEAVLMKLALGAALAASAGYAYFTHKEDIDTEAKKRINQLAKIFRQSKTEVEKRVKEIWGEVNKEAIARYLDVRANLLEALENENLQQKGKMAKQRYDAIVDMVLKKAQKAGLLNTKNGQDLGNVLKSDWKKMEKNMIVQVSKVQKKVNTFIKSKTNPSTLQKGQKVLRNFLKKPALQKTVKNGKKMVGNLLKKNTSKMTPLKNKAKKLVKNMKKTEQKTSKAIQKTIKKARAKL